MFFKFCDFPKSIASFFQTSAKKTFFFNSVLTNVLTYVSEYSEYGLSDSITHTHRFSRAMLLTLLILTGFHGPCVLTYSYSRGSESSPTHTHSYSLTRREFSNPELECMFRSRLRRDSSFLNAEFLKTVQVQNHEDGLMDSSAESGTRKRTNRRSALCIRPPTSARASSYTRTRPLVFSTIRSTMARQNNKNNSRCRKARAWLSTKLVNRCAHRSKSEIEIFLITSSYPPPFCSLTRFLIMPHLWRYRLFCSVQSISTALIVNTLYFDNIIQTWKVPGFR